MLGRTRRLLAAAVEAARRAEDFAFRRHVGRHDAVPAPEPLRLVEVVDDRDLPQEMMDEARRGRADAPGDPPDPVLVRPQRVGRRQVVERQEGR